MTLSRPEPTLTGGDFQCRHCRLLAGSSPSLPDGSNPSAAIVQSASDVQCSRLLKTTTILVGGVECLRPLAVGIHKTIFAWLRAQPDAQGASNTLLMDLIKAVLGPHVAQPQYLSGLLNCQDRFDLDGAVTGPVAGQQKARAQKAWQKIQKMAMPADEPSHPS